MSISQQEQNGNIDTVTHVDAGCAWLMASTETVMATEIAWETESAGVAMGGQQVLALGWTARTLILHAVQAI